jgi:glycosyltransferase involved in cell wall biosynthesis
MTASAPLRVLILSRAPGMGGVVGALQRLAKAFPESEVTPRFLTVGRRPGEKGVVRALFRMVGDLRALWRSTAAARFDIVQLNPSLRWRSLAREALHAMLLRSLRTPTLIFFRGWDDPTARWIERGRMRSWLFRRLFGPPFHAVVLAREFATWLQARNWPADHVHVSATNFDGELMSIDWARGLPPVSTRKVILFLGRLIPDKGADLALAAFRHLRLRHPQFELVIAGDGPDAQRLKTLAADLIAEGLVSIPGALTGAAKLQALSEAAIFILPTAHGEGLPNALLEALAAGCLPVVTCVGGIADLAEKYAEKPDVVLPIDARTVEGVSAALESALNCLADYESAQDARLAWLHERYSAEAVTAAMVTIYRRARA